MKFRIEYLKIEYSSNLNATYIFIYNNVLSIYNNIKNMFHILFHIAEKYDEKSIVVAIQLIVIIIIHIYVYIPGSKIYLGQS